MVNTPIPHSLKSEAKKAAKILREFTMPNAKTGPDKLIPVGIFARARGLAILTVFKAGFLVTARGGSGIVIAKVSDHLDYSEGWSAPSAIGLAGLGGGFEVGAEVTDFVIILNTQAAVEAFSKGGNLTLGGNFTIAVGPLGRNVEGDVAVRSPAAIYTYSRTKGIFAGISVEGSALIERKDANRKFYEREIRAYEILAGEVEPPDECSALYQVIKEHQELAARAALQLAKKQAAKHADTAKSRLQDYTGFSLPSFSKSSKSASKETEEGESSSKFSTPSFTQKSVMSRTTVMKRTFTSSPSSSSSSSSSSSPTSSSVMTKRSSPDVGRSSKIVSRTTTTTFTGDARRRSTPDPTSGGAGLLTASAFGRAVVSPVVDCAPCRAVALFPYQAQLGCDLSFAAGEEVEVLTRTDTQDDWWEGRVRGKIGIFPANYVRVM